MKSLSDFLTSIEVFPFKVTPTKKYLLLHVNEKGEFLIGNTLTEKEIEELATKVFNNLKRSDVSLYECFSPLLDIAIRLYLTGGEAPIRKTKKVKKGETVWFHPSDLYFLAEKRENNYKIKMAYDLPEDIAGLFLLGIKQEWLLYDFINRLNYLLFLPHKPARK